MNREQMLAALVRGGFSHSEANMVLDLSSHATDAAAQAIIRICDTAPEPLRLTIFASALGSLVASFADKLPGFEAALSEATKTGETNLVMALGGTKEAGQQ